LEVQPKLENSNRPQTDAVTAHGTDCPSASNSVSVKILLAKSAGVCFGVERALNLSEKALKEVQGPISSLGPLIHNPQTVTELSSRGLQVAGDLDDVQGTVVFRSHGVPIEIQEQAKTQGLNVIDATCPLVKVPQNFARKLSQSGYFVVIIGDKDHPEIKGVKSFVQNGEVAVVKSAEDVSILPDRERVGVICQTTLKKSLFLEVVEKCQARFKEVKVHNTICSATKDRQDAAFELAQEADTVIVIGGRNSSNTQKLYEISKSLAQKAHLIETETELLPQWFEGSKTIGITAGASTPHSLIEKVRSRISEIVSNH
jgi:(E)-4-hydroxy-3-methyl-but-2-enyl pyrophosphate reductase